MKRNSAAQEKLPLPLSEEAFELIAARFRILSEPMRLKILHALSAGEMTVGELVLKTGAGQANISRHLGILLEAGIVARRKDGLCAYYGIVDRSVFELCETTCLGLGQHFADRHKAVRVFASRHRKESV